MVLDGHDEFEGGTASRSDLYWPIAAGTFRGFASFVGHRSGTVLMTRGRLDGTAASARSLAPQWLAHSRACLWRGTALAAAKLDGSMGTRTLHSILVVPSRSSRIFLSRSHCVGVQCKVPT
jgi:hypothetical protein